MACESVVLAETPAQPTPPYRGEKSRLSLKRSSRRTAQAFRSASFFISAWFSTSSSIAAPYRFGRPLVLSSRAIASPSEVSWFIPGKAGNIHTVFTYLVAGGQDSDSAVGSSKLRHGGRVVASHPPRRIIKLMALVTAPVLATAVVNGRAPDEMTPGHRENGSGTSSENRGDDTIENVDAPGADGTLSRQIMLGGAAAHANEWGHRAQADSTTVDCDATLFQMAACYKRSVVAKSAFHFSIPPRRRDAH